MDKITRSDVAREAGVSESTVSRALRDSPLISADVRARVKRTAAELGYIPLVLINNRIAGHHCVNGNPRKGMEGARSSLKGRAPRLHYDRFGQDRPGAAPLLPGKEYLRARRYRPDRL